MNWLIACAVIVAAVVIGAGVSAQIRRFLSRPSGPEGVRSFAEPAGTLAFTAVLTAGLIAALGQIAPNSLDSLPEDVIAFIPKLLTAMLFLLVGNAATTLVTTAIGSSLLKASGKPQHQITRLVRGVLLGVFAVLSVSQLGVNTKIVDTIVSAVAFGTAGAVALLTAVGGRYLAEQIAAGRYLRRILRPGDLIRGDLIPTGIVQSLHGGSVLMTPSNIGTGNGGDDGSDGSNGSNGSDGNTALTTTFLHIPNATLLGTILEVTRTVTPEN